MIHYCRACGEAYFVWTGISDDGLCEECAGVEPEDEVL